MTIIAKLNRPPPNVMRPMSTPRACATATGWGVGGAMRQAGHKPRHRANPMYNILILVLWDRALARGLRMI